MEGITADPVPFGSLMEEDPGSGGTIAAAVGGIEVGSAGVVSAGFGLGLLEGI